MREQYIEYRDGHALLEGFFCYDESMPGPRPAVIINHTPGADATSSSNARRAGSPGRDTPASRSTISARANVAPVPNNARR